MLIPSQIIITYVRPSYWLPGLEIGWGFITGLIALTQNANQVYVLRVFLGLFESSAWPGMMTLFSQSGTFFSAHIPSRSLSLTLRSVLVYSYRTCQANGLLSFLPSFRADDVRCSSSCDSRDVGWQAWPQGMAVCITVSSAGLIT